MTVKKGLKVLGVIAGLAVVVMTALPTILHSAGLHPTYEGPIYELPGKRALIITLAMEYCPSRVKPMAHPPVWLPRN